MSFPDRPTLPPPPRLPPNGSGPRPILIRPVIPLDELERRLRPAPPRRSRRRLPLLLFIATCLSTLLVGGPAYAAAVMLILTAHELGHYLQARRYGVPASLPYFIPMPITPFGTMGAIIGMRPHSASSKALFDVAITGPLAGLVPALVFSFLGLGWSRVEPVAEIEERMLSLGSPLVFQFLSSLAVGPLAEGMTLILHPVAFAGWVGVFITALNLLPIGQLDGGHILYTLMPRHAHRVSIAFLGAAIVAVAAFGLWQWVLMILILLFLGPRHPPMLAGTVPLDRGRKLLGWLTLLFFLVGFTPTPIIL